MNTFSKTISTRLGDKVIEMLNDPTYGDIPTRVYKFRDWGNQWHQRMIHEQEIYYASANEFNDPFDCGVSVAWHLLKTDKIMCREYFHDFTKRTMIGASTKQQYDEAERLIAEGKYYDDRHMEISNKVTLQKLYKTYGVFSVTPVVDNILMWAHYANSHKGFCVGFDSQKLFNFVRGLGGEVMYSKDYPVISPLEYAQSGMIVQLMTKAEFWNYEIEYRLVKSNLPKRAVSIPKDIISEIIFGCSMPIAHKEEVIKLVKTILPHVKLFQAHPKQRAFELDIVSM